MKNNKRKKIKKQQLKILANSYIVGKKSRKEQVRKLVIKYQKEKSLFDPEFAKIIPNTDISLIETSGKKIVGYIDSYHEDFYLDDYSPTRIILEIFANSENTKKTLIKKQLEIAKKENYTFVYTSILPGDKKEMKLFESVGFKHASKYGLYIKL